ncbi:unnamed protein product [Lepidochelys kempii]
MGAVGAGPMAVRRAPPHPSSSNASHFQELPEMRLLFPCPAGNRNRMWCPGPGGACNRSSRPRHGVEAFASLENRPDHRAAERLGISGLGLRHIRAVLRCRLN